MTGGGVQGSRRQPDLRFNSDRNSQLSHQKESSSLCLLLNKKTRIKSNRNESQSSLQQVWNRPLASADVNICWILLLKRQEIFSVRKKALELAFAFISSTYYRDYAFTKICNITAVLGKGSEGLWYDPIYFRLWSLRSQTGKRAFTQSLYHSSQLPVSDTEEVHSKKANLKVPT